MAREPWHKAQPGPVVLITGPQEYLGARAVAAIRESVATAHPDGDVVALDASGAAHGDLMAATSPSLFAAHTMIIAENVHQCSDAFLEDALGYIDAPSDDVVLVLWHGGGNRGRKLITTCEKSSKVKVFEAPAMKKDADKAAFIAAEFRRSRRHVDTEAVRTLVDAVGADVRNMAAACAQLNADVPAGEKITAAHVATYYGGQTEATGFAVADAVVARNVGAALVAWRGAQAAGVHPVPIIAAIASRARTLIAVGSYRGTPRDAAKDLGMAPWQVDRAKRDVRNWTPADLGALVVELAAADEGVKGGSPDAGYVMERLITSTRSSR